jgi:hypothetical protein
MLNSDRREDCLEENPYPPDGKYIDEYDGTQSLSRAASSNTIDNLTGY